MANEEHLAILEEALEKQDISIWNLWRKANPDIRPNLWKVNLGGVNLHNTDLSNVDMQGAYLRRAYLWRVNLSGADLGGASLSDAKLNSANLNKVNLSEAKLNGADLGSANLSEANLSKAELNEANLYGANLSRANLSEAYLTRAELYGANLSEANLTGTILRGAHLIETNFSNAILEGCHIYGISAWDINLDGAVQTNLNISPNGQSPITVDNLKVAQFIYLLLNNAEIRDTIDTIAKKAVLILGRFKPERKAILDAMREDLRRRGFLPILFDFEKPDSRNLTETVGILARLARFVIVDLTDPSSVPYEVGSFIPNLPSVPVQPIILKAQRPFAMFRDLESYPWVLPYHEYESQETLLAELTQKVIQPAQEKAEAMKPKPF